MEKNQEHSPALQAVEALLNEVQAHHEDTGYVTQTLAEFRENYLSFSPNIFSSLSITESILVANTLQREPHLERFLARTLVGEQAYNLEFNNDPVSWIECIEDLPPLEQATAMKFIESLGINIIAEGRSWKKIATILKRFTTNEEAPLVQFSAEEALARVKGEETTETRGILTTAGKRGEGVGHESLSKNEINESTALARQILPSNYDSLWGSRFSKVAKDAVSIIDVGGIPQAVGRVEIESLKEPTDISAISLLSLKDSLNLPFNPNRSLDVFSVYSYFNEHILKKLTPEERDTVYQEVGLLNETTAPKELFDALSRIYKDRKGLQEERNNVYAEMMQKNEDLSHAFMATADELLPQILADLKEANVFSERLMNVFEDYIQEYKSAENSEVAFRAIEAIASVLERVEAEIPQSAEEFLNSHETLIATHRNNFEALREKRIELTPTASEEDYVLYDSLVDHVFTDESAARKNLQNILEGITNIHTQNVQIVEFKPYASIPNDTSLNPFLNTEEKRFTLLLQHVHEGRIRKHIDEALGIKLNEISLRSQIHLLRFLAEKDRSVFERIQETLAKHTDAKLYILESFLAAAQDTSYSEAILTLASTLSPEDTEKVFKKYTELTSELDTLRPHIQETLPGGMQDEQHTEVVIQTLLKKSNEFLLQTAKEEAKDSRFITKQLEEYKKELLLFGAIFKTAAGNEELSLEDIANTNIEKKTGGSFNEKEQNRLIEIFTRNSTGQSEELLARRIKDLTEALQSKDSRFYILEHQDEIAAFLRYDSMETPNTVYAGSLNVAPGLLGMKLGSALYRATLDIEGKENTIQAVVLKDNPIVETYLKDGFKITGERDLAGTAAYTIEREPSTQGNT